MTLNRQVWPGEYQDPLGGQICGVDTATSWNDQAGDDDADGNLPDDMRAELDVLRRLGFAKPVLRRSVRAALRNGTTVEAELLANEGVDPDSYFAALARTAGLPFLAEIDPSRLVDVSGDDVQLAEPKVLRLVDVGFGTGAMLVIVPSASMMAQFCATLANSPGLESDLAISTPAAVRRAILSRSRGERVRAATNELFEDKPRLSARIVLSGTQGFVIGVALSLLLAGFALMAEVMLLLLHISASSFFAAAVLLRVRALLQLKRRRRRRSRSIEMFGAEVAPVYTVMVALYREAAVVPQLLEALKQFDWPKSRLDIKLLCEEDDLETIEAIGRCRPPCYIELLEVPALGPRTKPKALNYGLMAARGDYLAIFDAEDRPDPGQLREAWARFERRERQVACLQAPLVISNSASSWLSALFALEYAGLFRGLLPMLARHRLPLPLGGTSNHFRTDVLREVGAWDPFNVTEDADLGLRLYRAGYRAEVLSAPTYEEAPEAADIWVKQRTRWFKGWLQTWLVTLRNAPLAMREMGLWPFIVAQLLIGGMLLSALFHPAVLMLVVIGAASVSGLTGAPADAGQLALFFIDAFNILGAYACFLALGRKGMAPHERQAVHRHIIAIPLYWIMMTIAAWRAVIDLARRPHFWEKTPHKPCEAIIAVESDAEITLRHLKLLRQAMLRRSTEIWSG